MTDGPTEQHDPDVISKSEFARRRNVAPARVTQWINAGQIKGAAIVGEGRGARIRETVACQQLKRSLDVSQRFGNGLSTRLEAPLLDRLPGQSAGNEPITGASVPPTNTVQDQIAEQKLIEIKRRNERERVEFAIQCGALIVAADARREVIKGSGHVIALMEAMHIDLATRLATEFKASQRDVIFFLRQEFRKMREEYAKQCRARAASLPEHVQIDLEKVIAEHLGSPASE
ncbi:hypothetical protein [uncultured Bradyrhizobium sp.]|uniref:hypothetical protein n=1 Tax=uncultured Bradyrhizobium sp. TaxID=199684 RepID=UPI00262BB05B|nr:hypothetical protein [uncultured Bradyrhizobium sp.]